MAKNHDAPQSNEEAILQNILGEHNKLQPPQTRVEELLLELLDKGIGGITYIGVTTTALTDGCSTVPVIVDGEFIYPDRGDCVFYNGIEFIWNGDVWQKNGSSQELGALAYKDSASGTISGFVTGVNSTFVGEGISATSEYIPQGNISEIELSKEQIASFSDAGTLPSCTFPGIEVVGDKIIVSEGSFDPGTLPTQNTIEVATGIVAQPTFTGTPGVVEIEGTPVGTITNELVTTDKEVTVE